MRYSSGEGDGERGRVSGFRSLIVCGLSVFIVLSIALVTTPGARAYGSGSTWQLGVSGTGQFVKGPFNGSAIGFWGWCVFVGRSSGTSADCQISQYLHGTDGTNVQCGTDFNLTAWHAAPGFNTPMTGAPDFWADSGSITISPAYETDACAGFLRGAGFHVTVTGPGSLALISAPPTSDIGFPAAAGHYSFNGVTDRAILFTQLQYQVTELP